MSREPANRPPEVRRPDADIREEVEAALWADETIRVLNRDSIRVEVRDGEVFLRGHVAGRVDARLADDRVARLPGVRALHNGLIADGDLQVTVAQALAADALTRPHLIRVAVEGGWVYLSGEVPTPEAQAAAEAAAARVPGVRGVVTLPRLAGEWPGPVRRSYQPAIGAPVHAGDGPAGIVGGVVIRPRSKLVTHLIVSRGEAAPGDLAVPVEAIERLGEGGVTLRPSRRQLSASGAPRATDFPPAPPDWQPPFPYSLGEVRLLVEG